jgi:hypothetical protein
MPPLHLRRIMALADQTSQVGSLQHIIHVLDNPRRPNPNSNLSPNADRLPAQHRRTRPLNLDLPALSHGNIPFQRDD